jgi:hypothetical protein
MDDGADDFYRGLIRLMRSIALLRSWLSPAQLAQFESEHQFDVIGGATGKRYRIVEGVVQNVFELDANGNVAMGLCFAPRGNLPAGDVMLAQKISLEADELETLRVANRFGSGRAGSSGIAGLSGLQR